MSVPLDLTRYSEKTRRALYDRIEFEHFKPDPQTVVQAIARGDFAEHRTAEEAGLRVEYLLGRWLVSWRVTDPIERPAERDLWELVTVTASPRGVLSMAEV
ncbi:MAG: hypothetical protein ABJC13_17970 [Acidobacteriota bacterium]